jgi:hypothetical protein
MRLFHSFWKQGDSSRCQGYVRLAFPHASGKMAMEGRRVFSMKRTATLALAFGLISTAQPVHAGPQATASEIFHLRTECGKLGDKVEEKNSNPSGEVYVTHRSRYDENSNRCYVVVKIVHLKFRRADKSIVPTATTYLNLYDGQTGNVMAMWSDSPLLSYFAMTDSSYMRNVSQDEAYDYIMRMMKDD